MAQSIGSHRKDEHLFLAEKYFKNAATADFQGVRLLHNALPETSVDAVDVATGAPFGWQWPFYINAMTGGSPTTGKYNAELGTLAKNAHLAIASGSQAVALREPALVESFTVLRRNDPTGFILANLGAGHDWHAAQQAVAMLEANALELHLNAAQELIMPEGERDFRWLDNIADVVAHSSVPVVVKEVGFGMTATTISQLEKAGVAYIDVAGRGGTNFAQIENARRPRRDYAMLQDFGQSTVESLLEAQGASATMMATGGVRTPLDIVKALRLGAAAVGVSGQILHWLVQESPVAAATHLAQWQQQLPELFALFGARNTASLANVPVVLSPSLENYRQQRGLAHP